MSVYVSFTKILHKNQFIVYTNKIKTKIILIKCFKGVKT